MCLPIALLSDIFDGILARRLGVARPWLRRYDSFTDLIFYLAILWCVWSLHAEVVHRYAMEIAALLLLEIVCNIVSFARFHRPPATHSYLAKLWGLLLCASLMALLGWGISGGLFLTMILLGCIVELEILAII